MGSGTTNAGTSDSLDFLMGEDDLELPRGFSGDDGRLKGDVERFFGDLACAASSELRRCSNDLISLSFHV